MLTPQTTAVSQPDWHDRFLRLLPTIKAIAARTYRGCEPELRAELTAQVLAECVVAFHRLHELGRTDEAFATPLARFAIKRVGCGLQPGLRRNQYDVGSRHCHYRHGATVERLQWQERDRDEWNELVVEDRRQSPALTAALRVDLKEWLAKLTPRNLKIAALLAAGERACDVAKAFNVTVGRISQVRRALAESWRDHHGFDAADPEFAWLSRCEAA